MNAMIRIVTFAMFLLFGAVLSFAAYRLVDVAQAHQLFEKHNYKEARIAYQKALRACQLTDCNQSPEILNRIAMCHIFTRQTDSAIQVYQDAVIAADRFDDLVQKEDALSALGEIFSFRGDAPRALEYFKNMLVISRQLENRELLMAGSAQVGSLFRTIGEIDSAKLYLDRAIALVDQVSSDKAIPMVFKYMGDFYADVTNYEDAQTWYLKCLDEQIENSDSVGMTSTLITIASMFNQQGQLDRSEEHLNNVLIIADRKGLRIRKAHALNELATIYQKRGNTIRARQNLMEALAIFKDVKNLTRMAQVDQKLARMEADNENYSEALKYYDNSIRIFDSLQTFEGSLASKIGRARVYQSMGRHAIAIRRVKEVLNEVQTRQTPTLEMDAYEILAESYAARNDFEEAYYYNKKFGEMRNRIFNRERAEVLSNTDKRYDIARKEKEILELQAIQFKQETKIERQQLFNGGLLLAGFVLAILAFIYYQNFMRGKLIGKQRKQIHEQKIKSLENENRIAQIEAMLEGQESERERIAKDLHDGLGGVLSTIKIQFDAVKEENTTVAKSNNFQRVNHMLDEAVDEVRRIAHNMMPEIISEMGLIPAIEDLAFNLRKKDIKVHLEVFELVQQLNPEMEKTVYRIVQELFSNIVKHAEADEVIVQFSTHDQHLRLVVEDNGKGFSEAQRTDGMGLKNISSRVDFLKGSYDVESQVGEGTTVTVLLPLDREAVKS